MLKTLTIASLAGVLGTTNTASLEISSNLYKSEIASVEHYANDEFLKMSDEGKFDYNFNSSTGADYEARFWLWDLTPLNITNNKELLENYSDLIPFNQDQNAVYHPSTYIMSNEWNDSNIQMDLSGFSLSNVKDKEITSLEEFKENATWLWESSYEKENINTLKWGISISTYTTEENQFVLQFTSGYDLQIKDKLDFKFGGQIAPYLKLVAAK